MVRLVPRERNYLVSSQCRLYLRAWWRWKL